MVKYTEEQLFRIYKRFKGQLTNYGMSRKLYTKQDLLVW
jgi:hypothetical protein